MLQAAHRHCAPSAPSVSINTWIQTEKVTEPGTAFAGPGKASGGAEVGAESIGRAALGIIVQSPFFLGFEVDEVNNELTTCTTYAGVGGYKYTDMQISLSKILI